MNLHSLISNYAGYNLWANQQFVTWLSGKPEEQLNQEIPSSFSGILKTLNHIWAMEAYWYSIITRGTELENRYGVTVFHKEEILSGLINRSELLKKAVSSFTESELEEKIKVVSPWFEANHSRYDYLQHLFNHGTYHRGQIVTIGRNLGITDAPGTDYLFYNVMQEVAYE